MLFFKKKNDELIYYDLKIILKSCQVEIAKVYFSIMGGKKDVQKQKNVIVGMNKMVRKRVAKKVMIKYIPEIRFIFDETPQRAQNIERILRKIREET